ncbi:MAG: DUF5658 family protein [Alphaproteobacteria bacterium]|nr:DUF5658 family protein [Alphaproteobacteria bacterium]
MFCFLYAYSYGVGLCFSCHSGYAVTKAVARMVSRFTAIKNRFIFRLRKIVGGELPLETETCRFVLISLFDLFMTFLLLYFSNRGMMRNVVVESNPVARYFISGWGTMGLVWFKIGMVTLIVLATQVVATRRPSVAQLLLNGATLFVGSVVVYSACLLLQNRI